LYFKSGKVSYFGSWLSNKYDGFGTLHNEKPIIISIPYINISYDTKDNSNRIIDKALEVSIILMDRNFQDASNIIKQMVMALSIQKIMDILMESGNKTD
jgi:hypothetical protein